MNDQVKPNKRSIQDEKEANGLYYGLIAGFIFAIAAWGIDFIQLSQTNTVLYWVKLAVGLPVSMLLCGVAGWLTARVDRVIVSLPIWALAGLGLTWFASHMPFDIYEAGLAFFEPQLIDLTNIYFPEAAAVLVFFTGLTIVGLFIIGGGLQMFIVDSATTSPYAVSRWLTLLLCIPFFAGAGFVAVDVLNNKPLREPLVEVDEQLKFIIANRGREITSAESRARHLGAFRSVNSIIETPYRTLIADYSSDLTQSTVVIQFNQGAVSCIVLVNRMAFCKPLDGTAASAIENSPQPAASNSPDPSTPAVQLSSEPPPDNQALAGISTFYDGDLQKKAMLPQSQEDIAALTTAPHYLLSVTVNWEKGSYSGQGEVFYTNNEEVPLDSLFFRLFPNGGSSYAGGSLDVSQVTAGEQPAETNLSLQDSVLEVKLPAQLQPGGSITVAFQFSGQAPVSEGDTIDQGYGIFNRSRDVLTLAGWYPALAVYDQDGWNLDPVSNQGDSVYADISLYQVTLLAPQALVVAATGSVVEQTSTNDTTQYTFASGPVREFFITLSPQFELASEVVDGVQVNSYYLSGDQRGGEQALQVAAVSLRAFNARFGEYPYAELDVIETPMQYAIGVEFPGIVLIYEGLYDELGEGTFETTVAHEVAHQWWYNLVGNDVYDEPWLDEALTTYSSSLYFEEVSGSARGLFSYLESRYNNLVESGQDDVVTQDMAYFEQQNVPGLYSAVVYTKGALFFRAMRDEIGDQAFFQALQNYYQDHRYGIARGEDLIDAFEAAAGRPLDDLVEEWLYSKKAS